MLLQTQTKAPYFPGVQLTQTTTRFGAIEVLPKNIYEGGVDGKVIGRYDALKYLEHKFGKSFLAQRDIAYKLFSGSTGDDEYRRILTAYYSKYPKFTEYIDDIFTFTQDTNLITGIVQPIRNEINERLLDKWRDIKEFGGKPLLMTHDYIYAAFKTEVMISDMEMIK